MKDEYLFRYTGEHGKVIVTIPADDIDEALEGLPEDTPDLELLCITEIVQREKQGGEE